MSFTAELPTTTPAFAMAGWTIASTASGNCLIADETVCGIEVSGRLADHVRRYLRANNLTGPIIGLPGDERREIHLATNPGKASLAMTALREMGAVVHADGAAIPLPANRLHTAGRAHWAVAPAEARWLPPVVGLSAAIRAGSAGRAVS